MIENTLSKIIEKKKFRINELKKSVSFESLKKKINKYKPYLNFKNKIIKHQLLLKLKKRVLQLVSL